MYCRKNLISSLQFGLDRLGRVSIWTNPIHNKAVGSVGRWKTLSHMDGMKNYNIY